MGYYLVLLLFSLVLIQGTSLHLFTDNRSKIPTYCKANPRICNHNVDSALHIRCVGQNKSKCNIVAAIVDANIVEEVPDILLNPPTTERYAHLKATILCQLAN